MGLQGILSSRKKGGMKEEDSGFEGPNPRSSKKLLEKFLSSSDFQHTPGYSTWEQNPLLKELARSLKRPEDFEYIEGLLGNDSRNGALMSTLHSMSSSGQISSRGSDTTFSTSSASTHGSSMSTLTGFSDTVELPPSRKSRYKTDGGQLEEGPSGSSLRQTFQETLKLKRKQSPLRRPSLDISEIEPSEESVSMHQKIGASLETKDILEKFQGVWEFKRQSKTDLAHLHRIMDLERSQIKKQLEQNSQFEIRLVSDSFSVHTDIIGLCSIDLPLSGSMVATKRFDQHEGSMEVHAEAKRSGVRMIYTWGHPMAGTRRDTFEVSSCGSELTIVGYITRRDGTNCKAKWGFVKHAS